MPSTDNRLPYESPRYDDDGHEYYVRDWAWVPGCEGRYAASRLGEIYSQVRNQLLTRVLHKQTGYLRVRLYRNTYVKMYYVHTAIALTFFGPCPEGMEVCHGPAGKICNHVNNLRYGTHQSNVDDHFRANPNNTRAPIPVEREDGVRYPSCYRASIENGLAPNSVSAALRSNGLAGGFKWHRLT